VTRRIITALSRCSQCGDISPNSPKLTSGSRFRELRDSIFTAVNHHWNKTNEFSEDGVRTISLATLFIATILFAGTSSQPLNVKPGLWHVTGTNQFMGNTMKTDYKTCVTAKDLNSNPWANGSDEKCTWTVVTSTASDLEVKGTDCELGKDAGMSTNIDLKYHAVDQENVNASMQGTSAGNGQTVNVSGTFTGKWMGSSCSANKN
jgi:hypothetical protein